MPGVGNRSLHQRPLHAGRHSKCRRYDDDDDSSNNDSVVVDCENDDSTHDTSNDTSNIRVVTEYNVDTINNGSDYADDDDSNNDDNNAR